MEREVEDKSVETTRMSGNVRITVAEYDDGDRIVSMDGPIEARSLSGCVAEGLAKRTTPLLPVERAIDYALAQYYFLLDEELPRVREMFSDDEWAVLFMALTSISGYSARDCACCAQDMAGLIAHWSSDGGLAREHPAVDDRSLVAKVSALTPLAMCALWDLFQTVGGVRFDQGAESTGQS